VIVESCAFGWDHVDWGSVPDWIAAIGTAGALCIAALAWRTQVRERHEAAQEAREAAEAKRDDAARERVAQSRQLTIWPTGGGGHSLNTEQFEWLVRVNGLNTSGMAFTDVRVRVRVFRPDFRTTAHASWPVLAPTPEGEPQVLHVKVVAPRPDPHNDIQPDTALAWLMTDASGVRWYRDYDGSLREVAEGDEAKPSPWPEKAVEPATTT
jgi:hypothetical protein